MKLLFDNNLSPRLSTKLADLYAGSQHVSSIGLDESDDVDIWQYAGSNGLIIVSKDEDFNKLSEQHGSPPKLIWLRIGNCTTSAVEHILRANVAAIAAMVADVDSDSLDLS